MNPRGPEDQQLSWPILIADLEVQRPGYSGALSPYLARLPRRPRNPMLKNVLSLRSIFGLPVLVSDGVLGLQKEFDY